MDRTDQYVKKLITGSYDAFTSLYKIYAPQLYAYVFSLMRSKSATNDIVQETFVKIWVKREEIRIDLSFKSYLFTIARNQLLNEFRRQVRNPVFSDYVSLQMIEQVEAESGIEQAIDFDEFNRRLQWAKQKISPRQAQIFEMNKEQGVSVEEIAAQLNIKEQVVRNQLSVALRTIREEMGHFMLLFVLFFMNND
ncbi:MAG: sigma-70 family RNA polymerase sigma factor [Tannerella sp.]|nr:sigma-70 family RNA polymerase sigma factor [Tannerella sp.]